MGIWALIFAFAAALTVAACVFLVRHIRKFKCVQKLGRRSKALSWLVAVLPLLVIAAFLLADAVNTALALIHLMVFWAVADGVGALINKCCGTTLAQKSQYTAGAVALVLTAAYFGYGWVAAHNVQETHYNLTTEKPAELRILQFSDSHVSALFDGEGFAAYLQQAQACNPDVVVVTGDFVDDDTSREDMAASAAALGNMKATYGVYFVYGNHDKGYGTGNRGFSAADLAAELQKNGVVILEDQAVPLGDQAVLVGRQDKSVPGRASMAQLMDQVNSQKYVVVLDHQPSDYSAQAESGVDLVLSGHTHGGQMPPIGPFSELLGMNDATYGLQRVGNTAFIVNSGIGNWAIQFKMFTVAEYGVIDVKPAS